MRFLIRTHRERRPLSRDYRPNIIFILSDFAADFCTSRCHNNKSSSQRKHRLPFILIQTSCPQYYSLKAFDLHADGQKRNTRGCQLDHFFHYGHTNVSCNCRFFFKQWKMDGRLSGKQWSRTEAWWGGEDSGMHTTVDDNPLRADNPSTLPYFPLFSLPQASVPQMTNSGINRVFQSTENIYSCSWIHYLSCSLFAQIHLMV